MAMEYFFYSRIERKIVKEAEEKKKLKIEIVVRITEYRYYRNRYVKVLSKKYVHHEP